MKPLLKKILVPVISAVVGGAVVIAAFKMSPTLRSKIDASASRPPLTSDSLFDEILKKQQSIRQNFDSLFDDEFFGSSDPFADMKKMREQMDKRMETFGIKPHSMMNPFDSWFSDKFGGGSVHDISKREDDGFVYYDIQIKDLNSTSINTQIENGYITISGTVEKKSGSGEEYDGTSSQSVYQSTFSRTFPLPENVDGNKMEMIPEKDKIVLKFPKLIT